MFAQTIISLVPSQTELLFDLGLEDSIVGITWFCIHPKEKCKAKAKVGGTKNLDLDKIRSLKPDLIIANKEENDRVQIETLAKEFRVVVTDIKSIGDAIDMIKSVGAITDTQPKANEIAFKIEVAFKTLTKAPPLSSLYLIWQKPYMSIGADTFIHHVLTRCGLINICSEETRYPELSIEEIRERNPQLVIMPSEPFPFKEKHVSELQAILPNAKILLADGEMFSWYGSRLIKAAGYLDNFIKNVRS
jgi:ABC-type Fe3+-hydroxamate transport system substrate-binding protein